MEVCQGVRAAYRPASTALLRSRYSIPLHRRGNVQYPVHARGQGRWTGSMDKVDGQGCRTGSRCILRVSLSGVSIGSAGQQLARLWRRSSARQRYFQSSSGISKGFPEDRPFARNGYRVRVSRPEFTERRFPIGAHPKGSGMMENRQRYSRFDIDKLFVGRICTVTAERFRISNRNIVFPPSRFSRVRSTWRDYSPPRIRT